MWVNMSLQVDRVRGGFGLVGRLDTRPVALLYLEGARRDFLC